MSRMVGTVSRGIRTGGGGEDDLGSLAGQQVQAEAGEHGSYDEQRNQHNDDSAVFLSHGQTPFVRIKGWPAFSTAGESPA